MQLHKNETMYPRSMCICLCAFYKNPSGLVGKQKLSVSILSMMTYSGSQSHLIVRSEYRYDRLNCVQS